MNAPPAPITLAADLPLNRFFPVQALLDAFAELAGRRENINLLLTGKRFADSSINVVNFMELNGLQQRIDYRPYYYNNCAPDLRRMDLVHIDRATPAEQLTADHLEQLADLGEGPVLARHLIFVTAFHPLKQEGNSTAMRVWLDHLNQAGYTIHLVYYVEANPVVTDDMREAGRTLYHHYYPVPIDNSLTGHNRPPLNVDVDDWCGPELLQAIENICDRYEVRDCIVNYGFNSGAFQALPTWTRKILLTHDRFADRNRNMQAQGFKDPGWVSLSTAGEKTACLRADVVVALQQHEADYFRELTDGAVEVAEVPPFFPATYQPPRHYDGSLRIGYFGSHNWVNEQNLVLFIDGWKANEALRASSRILVGGGVSGSLADFIDEAEIVALGIERLGRFDQLGDFFAQCDVVINPERGGTGIKIKTLETLAHGCPLLSTREGMVGLPSTEPSHQAANITALVDCAAKLAAEPAQLTALNAASREVYDAFYERSHDRLRQLLPGITATAGQELSDRVSIVIPIYNVEPYLAACLDSVQGQTWPALEVILVDDASTDGSAAIAEDYAARAPHIRVIHHERNQGLGPARHSGVEQASGDWLLFLDSDDLLPANAVKTLVDAAHQYRVKVTIGSSEQITDDGVISDYDRRWDHGDAALFGTISGIDAMCRSLVVGQCGYLPLRAWGSLIDRHLFVDSGLRFPALEHEDMPVMPFLYLLAVQVCYLRDPVLLYRQRSAGLSRRPWDRDKVRRYEQLWQHTEQTIERFALQRFRADIAIHSAIHLVHRMTEAGSDCAARQRMIEFLHQMQPLISEAHQLSQTDYTHGVLALLNSLSDDEREHTYPQIIPLVDNPSLLEHYRYRLTHLQPLPPPKADRATVQEAPDSRFVRNQAFEQRLLDEFHGGGGAAAVADVPAMLTDKDKALYFHVGRHFTFSGAIIDAGTFVGATSVCLAAGLMDNPDLPKDSNQIKGLIRAYDLFEIGEHHPGNYILAHLKEAYAPRDFSGMTSFQPCYEESTAPYQAMIDIRAGDITGIGYPDREPIEILGSDACKTLAITDFFVREFFTRLIPQRSLVLQQDYIHPYHPYIHLSMARLADCFETHCELEVGGSVSFRCIRAITPELIRERFGPDAGWYNEIGGNAMLLKNLEDNMLYEHNRWTLLLTRGVYFHEHQRLDEAARILQEAREHYPRFTVPDILLKMIEPEVVA